MHVGFTIGVTVLALFALLFSVITMNKVKSEPYANDDDGVDFYSYCVQQALDNNVLDPALIPMACANQDAYILSSGVHGNQW